MGMQRLLIGGKGLCLAVPYRTCETKYTYVPEAILSFYAKYGWHSINCRTMLPICTFCCRGKW